MKALILAAGIASRLRPLTDTTPKSLLKIGERTLLERSIDAMAANGITDFCIVTGYLREQIESFVRDKYKSTSVSFVHNPDYACTNCIYSLWLAREFADGNDFLLLDSDLLYDPRIITRLLQSPSPNLLTLTRHELGQEEMKIVVDAQGEIVQINKTCAPQDAIGESLGIEKIGSDYSRALFRELEVMMDGEEYRNSFYELAFERLIKQGYTYRMLDVSDLFSCELDTVEDFENARRLIPAELF
jgi:choline kinase